MKRILFIILISASALPAFSQSDKCPFGGKGTSRNDQYSKSSASDIKKSQSAMDKQIAQFQKPKYGYIVYAKKPKQVSKPQL